MIDTIPDDKRLRVFISYSQEDLDVVLAIAQELDDSGMVALYDKKELQAGAGFRQEIMNFIAHAHVFMPLLSDSSSRKNWVQQEIGYAVALRVPPVPVAIACDPGEFLHGIEAIKLSSRDPAALRGRLTLKVIHGCMQRFPAGGALYECAATTEERAVLLEQYAKAVTHMGRSGKVRQRGGLSSFHIPAETIDDDRWKERYGTMFQSEYHRRVLWNERLALTEHAKETGCAIIIDPDLDFSAYGGDARLVRLRSLLQFLRSMSDDLCHVALSRDLKESLTIVGNWFAAQSIHGQMGQGYRQTIFTRHAPTISKMIDEFDRSFATRLGGTAPAESRRHAIEEIERRIKDLEAAKEKRPRRSGME